MKRMKRIKTTLSFILSFVMLLCFLPHSVLAQIGEALTSEENYALTDLSETDTEIYVLGEMTESRTETSKTFRMSDGSYIAADYGKRIHYEDENGILCTNQGTIADALTILVSTNDTFSSITGSIFFMDGDTLMYSSQQYSEYSIPWYE